VRGARPVSEIAVVTPEEARGGGHGLSPAIRGATRMLEELGHQFDIVDSHSDLSPYAVVVLPDDIDRFALDGYEGGVLATFAAALDPELQERLGVRGEGPLPAYADTRHDHVDYLRPRGDALGLPPTEHAMYLRGVAVEATGEVLADRVEPYFDRTWEHFCSHLQTPSSGVVGTPAVVRGANSVYFAHPVFSQYDASAPLWCKTLVGAALRMLLGGEPLVTHDGPSSLRVALTEQEGRRVLHLLHYIPERRGRELDTIEDVLPLHDLGVSVRVPGPVRAVTSEPGGEALPFEERDGRVDLRLPRLDGHGLLAIELGP
jgi:hypothetical protein